MPDIMLLDIETMPNLGVFWGLWKQFLTPANILEERYIACASWKWLDGKRVHSASILSHPGTKEFPDLGVIGALRAAMEKADGVIAHNGDKFDLKWARGRVIMMGQKPLPTLIQIDTLKMARKAGYFNSYRLEYLAEKFGLGIKPPINFDVWKRALMGQKAAVQELVAYNKHDVSPLLEGVYLRLRPHVEAKVNRALFEDRDCCPACGDVMIRHGYRYTRAGVFHRLLCKNCGHEARQPLAKKGVIR